MPDDLDYAALAAAFLEQTIPPEETPGNGTAANPVAGPGKILPYFGDYLLEEEIARGSMVDKVALSPDATLLASAADHVIHIRDRASGVLRRILRGHSTKISALTFSPAPPGPGHNTLTHWQCSGHAFQSGHCTSTVDSRPKRSR